MMLYLISQRQLLPGIVVMGSFILFVLWMVGLIIISIELWGPSGSVNGNCNLYVTGASSSGPNINTLAYLEQHSICEYTSCQAGMIEKAERRLMLDHRPELDSGMGIPIGGMCIPPLDDDHGIPGVPRRFIEAESYAHLMHTVRNDGDGRRRHVEYGYGHRKLCIIRS